MEITKTVPVTIDVNGENKTLCSCVCNYNEDNSNWCIRYNTARKRYRIVFDKRCPQCIEEFGL